MDTSALTKLITTLRQLAQLEEAIQDGRGPQPCALLNEMGVSFEAPKTPEENCQIYTALLKAYINILAETNPSKSRKLLAMETTGKCVRALNSTTLKLPGDAKTIRRAVDALTARFTFRFPMRAVHARVVIDRTEGGVVRYVTPQFTFSEAMKESERMEEYREQTAEAKQVADELEGVVMRLDPKHAGRGGSPKEPKGRPVATDFKADQRIADAWKSPQHTTHADVARALNIPVTEVKKALDRHRQREAKAKRDKSRNSEAE